MKRLLLLIALLALVPGVALADESEDPFIPQQAIIHLVPGADLAAFNQRHQTQVLDAIPDRRLYLLRLPGTAPEDQIELELEADPDTLWSELNYEGRAPEGRPRDFWGGATPDPTPYQGQWAVPLLGVPQAQRLSQGYGVVVAVLDTGVDVNHPALAAQLLPGYSVFSDTTDVRDIGNGQDDDGDALIDEMTGHGTHVAGIVSLVAPAAQLLPIKVLDSDGAGEAFTIAKGIFYAIDHGANVINMSFGSTYNSDVVELAVDEAARRGIVMTASAGNLNREDPEESPARMSEVLGVAATDATDHKAPFSNYSERLSLSAPGVAISSTLPNNLYAAWSGTSMAAPFVAGGAALVLARHPRWTPNQVRAALLTTARRIDQLNPAYAGRLGAGRLDLAAASRYGLPACFRQGDLDQNGLVTTAEIQTIASRWHQPRDTQPETDLNLDGRLNLTDVQLAALNWNRPC
jgi:thermitase